MNEAFFNSRYEEAFDQADADGSGALDIDEFAMVLTYFHFSNLIVPSAIENHLSF